MLDSRVSLYGNHFIYYLRKRSSRIEVLEMRYIDDDYSYEKNLDEKPDKHAGPGFDQGTNFFIVVHEFCEDRDYVKDMCKREEYEQYKRCCDSGVR